MNRISSKDERILGPGEKCSFKSHCCEIKSLNEREETSLQPHLSICKRNRMKATEVQRGHQESMEGTLRQP
jgi:hypothetical protein